MMKKMSQVEQSFKELYVIYKPKNLDKFTDDFMKKYKIPKIYRDKLKGLVEEK